MFTAGFIKELTETVMGIFGFQTIQKIMLEKAYERLRKMEEERRGEGDPSVAEALVKRLPATEDLEGAFNLYLNTFSSLNVFVIDLFIMHTCIFWRSDVGDTPFIVTEKSQVLRYCR